MVGEAAAWTPASATSSGGVTPEHWYAGDKSNFQDSARNTAAASDGDVVGSATDDTANADHVSQGTAANKPTLQTNELNGESVFRFDGTNDALQGAFTTGESISQPYTIFVVAVLDASEVNDNNYSVIIDGDDVNNRAALYQDKNANPDCWTFYSGTILSGGASDSNWNIWTLVANGASSQFWANGVSEASGDAGAHALDGLKVGAQYSGIRYPLEGDVAEILIYNGNLSDADKNEIGQYLDDKYGITYTDIT